MRHPSPSRQRPCGQGAGVALLAAALSLALLLFPCGASAAAPGKTAGKAAPPRLCDSCYGPVVAGVQLGMNFERARRILTEYGRAHFSHLPDFQTDFNELPSGVVSFRLAVRGLSVGIVGIVGEHDVVTQIGFNPKYIFNITDTSHEAAIRAFCTSGAGVPCEGWEKEEILSGAPVECYSYEDPRGEFYIHWVRPPSYKGAAFAHENPMITIYQQLTPGAAPEDTAGER